MGKTELGPEGRLLVQVALGIMASFARGFGLFAAFMLLMLNVAAILVILQGSGVSHPLAPLQAFGWTGWSFSSQNADDVNNAIFWTSIAAAVIGFLYQVAMRALGRAVSTFDALKATVKVMLGLYVSAAVFWGMTAIGQAQTALLWMIFLTTFAVIAIGGIMSFAVAFFIDFVAKYLEPQKT